MSQTRMEYHRTNRLIKTSRPRIFWLSHSPQEGGAERMMIEYCERLATDFAITVAIPKGQKSAIWDRLPGSRAVVPVGYWLRRPRATIKSFYGLFAKDGLLFFPKLVRSIRTAKADIVITNSAATPGAALAARILGLPHVWYVHESILHGHHQGGLLPLPTLARTIGRLSDLVIVNSAFLRDELKPLIGEKLRQVPPLVPIDEAVDTSAAAAPSTLRLLMIGAISPEKRCDEAVRAVAMARGQGSDVALTFVGPEQPAYRQKLDRLIAKLNISDRITFLGPSSRADAHIRTARAVIVASANEGLGRVTIEAMKHGVPVLGARSGETERLLTQSGGGLLFDLGDIEGLATAIQRLASKRPLLSKLAKSGKEWATVYLSDTAAVDGFSRTLHELARPTFSRRG